AILQRIAADIDELARARRVADLGAAAALPDRRAERRRRVAEPDLDFREFCAAASCLSPSAPGTCSPLNATDAARPTSRPIRRTTRSGTASRGRMHDPCPCRGVQQTERPNVLPGAVVTGTPIPISALLRSSGPLVGSLRPRCLPDAGQADQVALGISEVADD